MGLTGGAATQDAGRDHREWGRMRDAGCRRDGQWRRGKKGWCHGNSQWRPGAGMNGARGASSLLPGSRAACADLVVGETKPPEKGGAPRTRTLCSTPHSGVKRLLEPPAAESAEFESKTSSLGYNIRIFLWGAPRARIGAGAYQPPLLGFGPALC